MNGGNGQTDLVAEWREIVDKLTEVKTAVDEIKANGGCVRDPRDCYDLQRLKSEVTEQNADHRAALERIYQHQREDAVIAVQHQGSLVELFAEMRAEVAERFDHIEEGQVALVDALVVLGNKMVE